jgi:hypothetical protein
MFVWHAHLKTLRTRHFTTARMWQQASLHLQPFAYDPRALLAIGWPCFGPGEIGILNAECVLDDLGSAGAVFAVDRLLKKIGHRRPHILGLDFIVAHQIMDLAKA